MIRPLLDTLWATSTRAVLASCWYSVILQRDSTAATRPCKILQHSGSSCGFGGPTAARADINYRHITDSCMRLCKHGGRRVTRERAKTWELPLEHSGLLLSMYLKCDILNHWPCSLSVQKETHTHSCNTQLLTPCWSTSWTAHLTSFLAG